MIKYISWADNTGYSVAAKSYLAAFHRANVPVRWVPMLPDAHGYAPVPHFRPVDPNAQIHCYVINLDRSTARLEHMKRVLEEAKVDFTRVKAVDARHVAAHPAYLHIPKRRGRSWVPGEMACLLSHYDVWTLVARGAEQFAAILEDDLHIDGRLREVLHAGALPSDADIVKLETFNIPVSVSRWAFAGPSGVGFARLLSLHSGSGGYIISRAAAQRAIGMLNLFDFPIDDAIFGPLHPIGRTFRTYQATPALVIQDFLLPAHRQAPELASLIEPERIQPSTQLPGSAGSSRMAGRLGWVCNLPARLVRSAWRRIAGQVAVIRFSSTDGAEGKDR